jgi:hypothetical protein
MTEQSLHGSQEFLPASSNQELEKTGMAFAGIRYIPSEEGIFLFSAVSFRRTPT